MSDAFVFVTSSSRCRARSRRACSTRFERHFSLLDADGSNTGCRKGLWANDHDGSFESLLFAHGVPRIATFETPGLRPIRARIACQRDLTQAFADYTAKNHAPQVIAAAAPGVQPGG